ncbi:hypothetical protein KI688_006561 [Linnemannia hyalina]|uniref:Uncharacterized protein n=1 Tax=Linnemannia hyalina TaxID=64524 RepID=A0A9P8BMZ0_9FUNG|nr:hypothetical protein KI688_006561 [Linnemannia hyalina]
MKSPIYRPEEADPNLHDKSDVDVDENADAESDIGMDENADAESDVGTDEIADAESVVEDENNVVEPVNIVKDAQVELIIEDDIRDILLENDRLKATTKLSKAFAMGLPEDTIHLIVQRASPLQSDTSTPHTLELEARMEELLMENENLRGGKSIVVLNVVLRPNRSECFSWTTDTETTSIKELERAIYDEYPDREDGDAKTNTRTLTVALETPTKKYTDFTLKEVNSLCKISNMEAPTMTDLPPFTGISTEALDSDLHRESLRRLLDELDSRIRAIPSLTNETTCSAYVCSFLTQAVLIFNGYLTLAPERPLRGRHGHGKVDYAIEALAKDGSRHVLGVTELESSLTVKKRKRDSDDNGDEERDEDRSVSLKAYGIVTDATYWFFVECTVDQSQDSGDRPKFRISKLKDIINYDKDTWRMHSEIPGRELQLKEQKFTTSGQSAGKMQRV